MDILCDLASCTLLGMGADMVDTCSNQYLNFGLEGGRLITLDRLEAVLHGPKIMQVNAIASDR